MYALDRNTVRFHFGPPYGLLRNSHVLAYLDARQMLAAGRRLDGVINTVAEAQAKLPELRSQGVKVTDADFFALVSDTVAIAAGFFPTTRP